MLNLALAVSGSGTSADFVTQDAMEGSLYGKVGPRVLVASRECQAVTRFAHNWPDVARRIISPRDYTNEEAYAKALGEIFDEFDINVYGQYGLTVKTPIAYLPKNVIYINQHPVPRVFGGRYFKDLVTHYAVLAYMRLAGLYYMYSECITHEALVEYDTGKILQRVRVPLCVGMTPEKAQERTISKEWICQVLALHRLVDENFVLREEFPRLSHRLIPSLVEKAKQEALEHYGYA